MKWEDYKNTILAKLDVRSYYTSVLENVEVSGDEAKAHCPFAKQRHEGGVDKNPSFTVNLTSGVYNCPTCHIRGNIHTFHRDVNNLTGDKAWHEFGDGLGIDRPEGSEQVRPDIDINLPIKFHRDLMASTGPIRDVLKVKRGISDKSLVEHLVGWDGERLTIPIYDEYGVCCNIRKYAWNADEGKRKVLNHVDAFGNTYGELRVYGLDNLLDKNVNKLVWCGGETDKIVAEQHGFPAACATSGEGSFKQEWIKHFKHKDIVYIVQDNDEPGRLAAKKLYDRLKDTVVTKIVKWPDEFVAKGDITDWFVEAGKTEADFQHLLDTAVDGATIGKIDEEADDENAISVHLADSSNAEYYKRRIKVPVLMSGKDTSPFMCPKVVDFNCQCDPDNKKCSSCFLNKYNGNYTYEVDKTSELIMKLIKCTDGQQLENLKEHLKINKGCKAIAHTVVEMMNTEEVRLVPKADTGSNADSEKEYVVRTGYIISKDIKTNKRYTLYGSMYNDPQTQYVNYVFDKAIPEKDLASDFELTNEAKDALRLFAVAEGQTVEDKINIIHADLERNVTKIWERRDVAIAVDLIYNSVLQYFFQGDLIERGWTELMLIGDSGQAKSTIVKKIMKHYRLGEIVSGESSSRTGLVYSLQQTNKRWFLNWGALPLNDGGLLVIDELSGVTVDDLGQLSDVRTSGIAKVNGVITAETTSRTRVIYISNPRNGKQLRSETYGAAAIAKLWGKTEDVRRLDVALAVASGDIDTALLNLNVDELKKVPHVYTSDLCNLRTLWAWSRRPEQVTIEKDAEKEILIQAAAMGTQYSSGIPLVEASDQKNKIARLSIACAATVASTDESFANIVVKKEHVQYVVAFLHKVFSAKSMGYDKYSAQETKNSDSSDETITKLRHKFMLLPATDLNELAETLYSLPYMDRFTLADYTGLDRTDLQSVLKFLTTNNIVEKFKSEYRRLPLGTALLDNLMANPITSDERKKVQRNTYASSEY